MSREAQGLLIAVTGVVAVRLAVTGGYLSYLKVGMRWPLLAAGLVLVVIGAVTLVRGFLGRGELDPHRDGDGHEAHDHGSPRVAWLLVLPVLAVLLVEPAPLGAYAANRDTADAAVPATRSSFEPLPAARDGAVDLTLGTFLLRSYWDRQNTMEGVTVRLVGFVVNDAAVADGYRLTRFQLACCAADALALQVAVHGVEGEPPEDDTWVEVMGEWIPPEDESARGPERGADLQFASQRIVDAPDVPYE